MKIIRLPINPIQYFLLLFLLKSIIPVIIPAIPNPKPNKIENPCGTLFAPIPIFIHNGTERKVNIIMAKLIRNSIKVRGFFIEGIFNL